jgi:uncharacterized protein YndB with AHSA1/START domain
MSQRSFVAEKQITIKASTDKVWKALTDPAETKKYMFGCEALSDWKEGSPLIWKGDFNGVELIAVKGTILKIQPGKFLAYTAIDPNSTVPDLPENYLTVTCDLSEQDGQTVLAVTQGDYSTVADGDKRYQHTVDGGGWSSVLDAIKKLIEEG